MSLFQMSSDPEKIALAVGFNPFYKPFDDIPGLRLYNSQLPYALNRDFSQLSEQFDFHKIMNLLFCMKVTEPFENAPIKLNH